MNAEETRALLIRWFNEVWNERKRTTIYELFSPDGKAYGWPDPSIPLIGPEKFAEQFDIYTSAFSDIHMEIDDIVAEGNHGAIRWSCSMKHTGDALGFAATDETIALSGASFMVCEAGQLIEGWNFLDQTALILRLQAAAKAQADQVAP